VAGIVFGAALLASLALGGSAFAQEKMGAHTPLKNPAPVSWM
jgi:hypothetical protein